MVKTKQSIGKTDILWRYLAALTLNNANGTSEFRVFYLRLLDVLLFIKNASDDLESISK